MVVRSRASDGLGRHSEAGGIRGSVGIARTTGGIGVTKEGQFAAPVRRLLIVVTHLALWAAAFAGAFLLRFEGNVPRNFYAPAFFGLMVLLLLRIATFWFFGLFHGLLRYAGIPEVRSIVQASTLTTIVFVGIGVAIPAVLQPRSIYLGEWVLGILATSGLRLVIRMMRERSTPRGGTRRRAILIGAGDAGEMFMRDLERVSSAPMTIAGILDDDPAKSGSSIHGVPVLGAANETTLRRASEDLSADLVVLALPSASGTRTRELVSLCRSLGLETKTLPSLQQILTGDVKVSMLRDVAIEDLLRREPVKLDEASMAGMIRGKRVLVTGGAGSIGSELARQVARYDPALIALVDHNENALFYLDRELRGTFGNLSLDVSVADIKDPRRMSELFRRIAPHVVLHAAAHKHVPLMEAAPGEAIKNNVFGTRIVADLASAYGVETFVLISTDKAVNPSSVMGASKRIAEMYLQSISGRSRTRFVAVRFGNVLGSAGSVVPLFREQIAAGGPVTVTHPDMRRYFMTIPEASQLVLQAGALAKGGEIFLLDMGEPVKIVDLARDMIRMSGLEPDVDIPIVFSGKRPGEKLYEELLLSGEGHQRTVHPKILVGRIAPVSEDSVAKAMRDLAAIVDEPKARVLEAVTSIVSEAKLDALEGPRSSPAVDRALTALEALPSLSVDGSPQA